jgi:hypothetical protein
MQKPTDKHVVLDCDFEERQKTAIQSLTDIFEILTPKALAFWKTIFLRGGREAHFCLSRYFIITQ